jgi:hypothetical protein
VCVFFFKDENLTLHDTVFWFVTLSRQVKSFCRCLCSVVAQQDFSVPDLKKKKDEKVIL